MLLIFLFSSILLPLFSALFVNYTNYTIYRAMATTPEQMEYFVSLKKVRGIDFWASPGALNRTISLMINPEGKELFLNNTEMLGINVTTVFEDAQSAFERTKISSYINNHLESFDWNHFYGIDSIYSWLRDMATVFNDSCQLINMGRSVEGREILGIHIRSKQKANVFVEGGIHGREWISPAFVTYLIDQLVRVKGRVMIEEEKDEQELIEDAKNATVEETELFKLLSRYNWHIFPVVNPDGYWFSTCWDRSYKKNRRREGNAIRGVDLNRNFDYNFQTSDNNENRAHDTYPGPHAFSEPESKAIADYIANIGEDLVVYMSFHSFGQFLVLPYADSKMEVRDGNYDLVENVAMSAMYEMQQGEFGTIYQTGTAFQTLGFMYTGSSVDWVKKKYNVPLAVTFVLRDKGNYGHAMPHEEILPTCVEMLIGVLRMVSFYGDTSLMNISYVFNRIKNNDNNNNNNESVEHKCSLGHEIDHKIDRKIQAVSSKTGSFSEKEACVAIAVVILNIFLFV